MFSPLSLWQNTWQHIGRHDAGGARVPHLDRKAARSKDWLPGSIDCTEHWEGGKPKQKPITLKFNFSLCSVLFPFLPRAASQPEGLS